MTSANENYYCVFVLLLNNNNNNTSKYIFKSVLKTA